MFSSPVDIANEQVSIVSVLLQMGVDVPDSSSGTSWKANCPFEDFYHIDRGRSKSLRVYFGSNSAFCFQGCGYLTPVTLFSMKTGLSKAESALFLLQSHGIVLPSVDDQLQSMLALAPKLSKASLREALQLFCQREVGAQWMSTQFHVKVIEGMDSCLKLLDRVEDEDDAKTWLEKSKIYMKCILKDVFDV